MDVYKIIGKLVLEGKDQFNQDVVDTKKKGSDLASSIGKGLATVAKVGAAAIGACATAVGALTKVSIENYAEYEQLVDGSKLLFGDAYEYIAEQAKTAYKDVQMSQNDYLQQVNGFATGLKTALGGNEQAAAELATKIIKAEADVVAATGNTQEAVQNAFNGIMKNNFTMLDNLQLGITPTKEGFQDLIKQVNEYNKTLGKTTDYQIDNLADCQAALVDYIEMHGLSGYASNEAAETIQGSISMVKAAWQDLMTGLADENADIDSLINNLTTSAVTAAQRVAPKITQVLNGMSKFVTQMAPVLSSAIPVIVTEVVPGMLEAGVQLLQSLLDGIAQNIDAVSASAVEVIMMLANVILQNLPTIISVGMQLIVALITGIAQQAPELVPVIVDGIVQAWSALIAYAPQFLQAGISLIGGLGDGLMTAFTALFPQIGPWVEQNIYQPIKDMFGTAIEIGGEIVSNLWAGLRDFANMLFPGLGDLITGYTDEAAAEATGSFDGVAESAKLAGAKASKALTDAAKIPVDAETPVSSMAEVMQNDTSMETAGIETVERAVSAMATTMESDASIEAAGVDTVKRVGTSMQTAVNGAGFDSAGKNAMEKFANGLRSMESTVLSVVDAIASKAVQRINNALKSVQSAANNAKPGGYAKGLDYVPYDEFPALLHKGEAVLTATEAAAWRAGKSSESVTVTTTQEQTSKQSGITIVQNIQTVPQTPVEFAAATEAYFEQARWSMA